MSESSTSINPNTLSRRREVVSLKIEDPRNKTNFLKNLSQYGIKAETEFDQQNKEEMSLQNIWNVFSKKERRTLTDNQIIINYLQTMTEFVDLIKRSLNNDYRMVIELLTQISFYLSYEKFDRNKLLFKFGDRGDKFYIILNGSVDVLIPKSRKVKITEMDYLYYLATLDQYGELDILKMCLQDNIFNYELDFTKEIAGEKPRASMSKVQFSSKKNSLIRMSTFNRKIDVFSDEIRRRFSNLLDLEKQRKEILKLGKIEQLKEEDEESSLDSHKKNNINDVSYSSSSSDSSNESDISIESKSKDYVALSNLRNKVKNMDLHNRGKKFVINISTQEYIDRLKVYKEITYNEVGPTSRLLDVVVYDYALVSTLLTGNKFGDIALNGQTNKRSATIITSEDTHLTFLDKEHYLKCIFESNEKVKKANINFLTANSLFKELNRDYFDKKYYNYFNYVSYDTRFKLTQENQEVNKIYFLKEGEYEVTMNRSLKELTEIIKYLSKNNLELNLIASSFDKNENQLCHINPYFKKFYNTKRLFRIRIIKGKDTIGLRDVLLDKKCLFDIECISTHSEFFSIDKKFFDEFYENVYEVTQSTQKFLKTKINLLVEKLIQLREVKIQFFKKSSLNEEDRINAEETHKNIDKINMNKSFERNTKMFGKIKLNIEENFKLHNMYHDDIILNTYDASQEKKIIIPKKIIVIPENLKIDLQSRKLKLKTITNKTETQLDDDYVRTKQSFNKFSHRKESQNTLTSSPEKQITNSKSKITLNNMNEGKDNDNKNEHFKILNSDSNNNIFGDSTIIKEKRKLYQNKSSHLFLEVQSHKNQKLLPNTFNKTHDILSKLSNNGNLSNNSILNQNKPNHKLVKTCNTFFYETQSRNYTNIKEMQKLSFSLNDYHFLPKEEDKYSTMAKVHSEKEEVSNNFLTNPLNENKKNYKEAVSNLINSRARIFYSPEKTKLLRRFRYSDDNNIMTIDAHELIERKRDNLIKHKESVRMVKAKHSLFRFSSKLTNGKTE